MAITSGSVAVPAAAFDSRNPPCRIFHTPLFFAHRALGGDFPAGTGESWLLYVARGGGTVHPAIPDLRRTYGSVYARFTLGSTPVLRFGFVGFASGLVGIRTGLVRISGFVPDFVPKKSNESPLGATWGLFWPF